MQILRILSSCVQSVQNHAQSAYGWLSRCIFNRYLKIKVFWEMGLQMTSNRYPQSSANLNAGNYSRSEVIPEQTEGVGSD